MDRVGSRREAVFSCLSMSSLLCSGVVGVQLGWINGNQRRPAGSDVWYRQVRGMWIVGQGSASGEGS